MKIAKDPLSALELLNIAAKVEALATQASQESPVYRLAGRLARNPQDDVAHYEVIIDATKRGGSVISTITGEPMDSVLLQCAIARVSMHSWEKMWNSAHPDQFGRAWKGEDAVLKSVWREKVRAMINDCHQGAILEMSLDEYFAQVIADGQSKEVAQALVVWILMIHGGGLPIYLSNLGGNAK
jgi:hypothetical protein